MFLQISKIPFGDKRSASADGDYREEEGPEEEEYAEESTNEAEGGGDGEDSVEEEEDGEFGEENGGVVEDCIDADALCDDVRFKELCGVVVMGLTMKNPLNWSGRTSLTWWPMPYFCTPMGMSVGRLMCVQSIINKELCQESSRIPKVSFTVRAIPKQSARTEVSGISW